QRLWWENERLTKDGKSDGNPSLFRLRELQRAWLASEGLGKGQPCKDPAGALARLEKVNRQWWNGESLARANPGKDEDTEAHAEVPSDADLKVQLLEKAGTQRFLEAGGSHESEAAVHLGLQWLASQQQLNGSWPGKGNGQYAERAGQGDLVGTAFGVWPFLARGETHKGSEDIKTYTKV